KKTLYLFLFGLLILGMSLAAKPTYRAFKTFRADRMLQKAEQLVESNQIEEAENLIYTASRLDLKSPEPYRLLALTHEVRNPYHSILYWQQYWKRGTPSLNDYHSYLHLLLALIKLKEADPLLTDALHQDPRNAETLLLCARYALLGKDYSATLEFAEQAIRMHPSDRKAHLFLGQLLLSADQTEAQTRGEKLLWNLINGDDETSLTALLRLSRYPGLSSNEVIKVEQSLKKHPSVQPRHILQAQSMKLRAAPEKSIEVFAETVAAYQESNFLALTQWLNSHRAFSYVLHLIPTEEAFRNRELFPIYVEAMEHSGNIKQLIQQLKNPKTPPPLTTLALELLLGRLYLRLEQADFAALHWKRARIKAPLDEMQHLAEYFISLGLLDEAEHCLVKLNPYPSLLTTKTLTLYFEVLRRQGKTRALLDLMKIACDRHPDKPAFTNNWIYLSFLLKQGSDSKRTLAESLHRRFPSSFPFSLTYSFALFQSGSTARAQSVLSTYIKPDLQLPAPERLLIALIMERPLKGSLSRDEQRQLLPEEFALYEQITEPSADDLEEQELSDQERQQSILALEQH
ncbi:MAG: hypothetical protein AAF558_12350, partial [Verrucomicrobiota bacterium]